MGAANYINQLITKSKKHIDNNTIIVGDFNTPLTEMDRSSKQKINREIKVLNDTLDQMDITDIQNISSQSNRIHILLQCTWNILQNKSRPGSQIRSQPVPKIGIIPEYFQITVL